MDILYIGIGAIIVISFIAIYVIAKMVGTEKLVGRAILSFSLLLAFVGGGVYVYLGGNPFTKEEVEEVITEEKPYVVKANDQVTYFPTFSEAVAFSRSLGSPVPVYFFETLAWDETNDIPSTIIQVPLILQLPELARGSEVTSLTMLLNYAGVKVRKLELAALIRKDQTPLSRDGERIFYGHPNDGFVGNIYSTNQPGIGVFHKPILELAENFLPEKMVDMTGAEFEDILHPIHQGIPVWALIHTQFRTLPESSFQKIVTPSGEIEVTPYQHAVLITGFDERYVYFNDPTSKEVNRPILKEQFKAAWQQMGSQAISYVK
ncbi:hypothetical protein DS745_09460 [Anaerobacillus alkaliphilus]|uniref:Peptidase C39-like domain-containing protein n=1 Tax=Anaerobacillus alkaliphilus TaxID=1548597 RepID=A0A4Q0VT20_9BACI|nr:C39 family peptidase [Anaerobacillus alkaliphilus]RXJ01696.1 hypothetical protein DS745_09460 [Anaerobacillus alkaliphilus]